MGKLLHETICTSDDIDQLSWFDEVLFYRLIVTCDDFGVFDGRIKIIKASCFPLKNITEKDVEKSIYKLSAVGLVRVYEAQGRPYLQLVTWEKHQYIRTKKHKYPVYKKGCKILVPFDVNNHISETDCNNLQQLVTDCNRLNQSETTCNELKQSETDCNKLLLESNSNPNTNPNTNPIISSEQKTASEPVVITLVLNTGEEYPVVQKEVDEWGKLYPSVDVMQELRNMKGWCDANPAKRKTKRGIRKFINAWLSRTQDRGGSAPIHKQNNTAQQLDDFYNMAAEWASNRAEEKT